MPIVAVLSSSNFGNPATDYQVIDPQIVHAGIFRPGLAMIVREAAVLRGVHTFRLKHIPEALDNSLWFDSEDGATISDILTHFKMETHESTVNSASIQEYLMTNIGKRVNFDVRQTGIQHVTGQIMQFRQEQGGGMVVIKSSGSLAEYPVSSIVKLQLQGLKPSYKQTTSSPDIDVIFKVKTDHPSHIRISSLEVGAAWNASYRVTLGEGDAEVTSKAQVAVAGLRLDNADVDLVAGMPDLARIARLDLTTGLASLNDWLNQRTGATVGLHDNDVDPYLGISQAINQGWGGGGGFGGGGAMPQTFAKSSGLAENALADRVQFIDRVIQAARLEDTYTYPFGHISLEPGERLTRDLSTVKTPVRNHYVWTVSLLPGGDASGPVRRVLSLKNTSLAPWPGGTVFLTRNDIPLGEVEMPFTLNGNYADIAMGQAEDIAKSSNVNELSRAALSNNWRYTIKVEYEAILHIQNTRLEVFPLDINFDLLGDVHSTDGGTLEKVGNFANWENPNSHVSWHFDLEPNEKKELHIKYSVNI